MALIISKEGKTFHEVSTETSFNELYCRISVSAHKSGIKMDVRVDPFASQLAYQNGAAPLDLKEKADIEWQKSFDVEGMDEQTPANAHLLFKAYLESQEGGAYTVSIL